MSMTGCRASHRLTMRIAEIGEFEPVGDPVVRRDDAGFEDVAVEVDVDRPLTDRQSEASEASGEVRPGVPDRNSELGERALRRGEFGAPVSVQRRRGVQIVSTRAGWQVHPRVSATDARRRSRR